MDLVCRVSLLVYIGTLELAGTPVVIGVDIALYVLPCIARSVILISCRISLLQLTFPKFFIVLAQSAIAVITLSACVMVGQVIFLWLKCMVYVKRLLLVDFMWHRCVRLCSGDVAKYHPSTVWYSHVPLLSVFSCTCTDTPI